jgi:Tol biopolymer transport system component
MASSLDRLTEALQDRYTLERELGAGGMATVYLADDPKHHRKVALKVLRPDLAATLGPERFLREVTIAANLQHPHILPVYDSGEADGFLYYVMPYVEGESLRDRLVKQGELPLTDAIRILRDVADAMAAAHAKGVVHRDIKPENIMLSGRHALVADFGVAKAVSEATGRQTLTTAGVALGTPTYMAPEQAAADPHTDHRADLYALGVLAYEMVTGQPPFVGATPQAVLAAHVTEAPVNVTQRRATLPPALAQLIMRCLAKKPADRPQSAEELLPVLESLGTPSGGVTPTQTQPVQAVHAKRTWLRVAVSLVVLGTVGVLAWLRFGSRELVFELGEQIPVTKEVGLEIDPALSRDGSFLAYAAGPILATRIYVRQVEGGRPVAIGDSNEVRQRWPKWSPDGQKIVFCQGTTVVVVPALGGRGRVIAQARDECRGVDWSPDGRQLVVAYGDSLHLVDANGGPLRSLTRVPEAHSPVWSGNGESIAVVSGNRAFINSTTFGNSALSTIIVVPVAGGASFAVTDGRSLAASPTWLPGSRALLFVSDRDGAPDIYLTRVGRAGSVPGSAVRQTTGLNTHSISVSRDGQRLAYEVYTNTANIWSLPIPRAGPVTDRDATRLTHEIQYVEDLRVSWDGKWVVFDSDVSGRFEIYRVSVDGGDPVQLTDAPGLNFYPAVSPDGSEIAFQSQRNGNRDLFLMPFAGGSATPLVVGPGHDNIPQWLPDGRLGFAHFGGELPDGWYVVERKGAGWSEPHRVAVGLVNAVGRRGLLMAFPDSLVEQSIETGVRRALWSRRTDSDPLVSGALYSRDETRIYFRGEIDSLNPQLGIWELPLAGGAPRQIVRFDDRALLPLRGSWDTDGKRFYFTRSDRKSDIWMANVHFE